MIGAGRRAAIEASLLLGLYLVGALHWVLVLGTAAEPLRGPSFTHEDWPQEGRYYRLLQQTVRELRVPYYISRPVHTRRFLAIPEVNWSPQIVLLRVLDIGPFVLVNTLLLYSVGFAGLLVLRRRFRLSLAPFALLFLLFSFNGHVVAHLAVGHSMWVAHFLLAFVVVGVLDLVEGGGATGPRSGPSTTSDEGFTPEERPTGPRSGPSTTSDEGFTPEERPTREFRLALVLFLMSLQGGFHHFTWCALFLALLALFERQWAGAISRTLLWGAALSACRLLPAYFLVHRMDQTFMSGFPSLTMFWQGLLSLRGATAHRWGGLFGRLHWWEYDFYVGLAGVFWLGFFGIWRAGRRNPAVGVPAARVLVAPLSIMTLLSFGDIFAPFNALPVPLVSAERVSSRFFAVPLAFLIVFAAVAMQRWLEARPGRLRRSVSGALVLLVVASLAAHTRLWRLERLEQTLSPQPGHTVIAIADAPDPPGPRDEAYMAVARASVFVSFGALCLLAVRWVRWRRSPPPYTPRSPSPLTAAP